MSGPRIGSLCSGYGGLEMGLQSVVGGTVVWHAEYDDAPARILAHHWPDVPNLRDITEVDWSTVEPVDLITAGYPCGPFSNAGLRKGADDERHLWPDVGAAVGALRPGWVFLENVAGHVSLGLDVVVGDLAALGYDSTWGVVRASDVGAPHGRARVFVLARDADGVRCDGAGRGGGQAGRAEPAHAGVAVADPDGQRREGPDGSRATRTARVARETPGRPAPDPDRDAVREQPVTLVGRSRSALPGLAGSDAPADADADADGHGQPRLRRVVNVERDADGRGSPDVAWGPYEPAVRRWERVLGRPAPDPTEPGRHGKPRLSPTFVEWLMGLLAGHVTAVPGVTRGAQLKALGNGVVPQQAALAVRLLLDLHARHAVTSTPRRATA